MTTKMGKPLVIEDLQEAARRQVKQAKILQGLAIGALEAARTEAENTNTPLPLSIVATVSQLIREQTAIEWERLQYLEKEQTR